MNRITNGKVHNIFIPQIHNTIVSPIQGITDKRFVITVAPQYDICPRDKT